MFLMVIKGYFGQKKIDTSKDPYVWKQSLVFWFELEVYYDLNGMFFRPILQSTFVALVIKNRSNKIGKLRLEFLVFTISLRVFFEIDYSPMMTKFTFANFSGFIIIKSFRNILF